MRGTRGGSCELALIGGVVDKRSSANEETHWDNESDRLNESASKVNGLLNIYFVSGIQYHLNSQLDLII